MLRSILLAGASSSDVLQQKSGGGKPAGSQGNMITQVTNLRHSHRKKWEQCRNTSHPPFPVTLKVQIKGIIPAIALKLEGFAAFLLLIVHTVETKNIELKIV